MADSPEVEEYEPIPYKIDSILKKRLYKIKVEDIYDPSKFWIIIHFRELAVFTSYLTSYYETERRLAIPRVKMRRGMICIVYRNAKYYRALIQPVMLPEYNKKRVFLVDYGHTVNVEVDNIYYLLKKHQDVPRFAIRASLAYLSPTDDFAAWSIDDLKIFCGLICEKELLIDVLEIDDALKTLHVHLLRIEGDSSESINDLMVKMSIAKISQDIPNIIHDKKDKYHDKLKFMHLFPSFSALEQGTVPCSIWEQNLLECVPKDMLYPGYFQYNPNHTNRISDTVGMSHLFVSTGF